MTILETIENRARRICPRIVFPEADQPRILQLAAEAAAGGLARPILAGNAEAIRTLATDNGISLERVTVASMDAVAMESYAERLSAHMTDMSPKMIQRKLKNPLYFAACMVTLHKAESFIAGYTYSTGEVILAAASFIGMRPGISTVSSFNLVTIPGFEGSEGESLIFTDVAVCVNPDAAELAAIASLAADAASKLLGWKPRVAFLSYSTKGSGESEQVDKVRQAVQILHQRRPDILADGEFQLEAAVSETAAKKKLAEPGPVAGRANIVVFPDLNAGNTNIKSVKLFAHANSIGPILTGFRKPVSDLSRTGSPVHQLSTVAAVAALCGETEQ